MKLLRDFLTKKEIEALQTEHGNYMKVTVEIEKEIIIVGCKLHADGEQLILDNGGKSDNIWGGGIDFITKKIATTAVLNLRPRLGNDNMEILDPIRREKFTNIVSKYFKNLWP